jgi:hypothetical protein
MAKQKEKTRYEQLLQKLTDPKFIQEQNKRIEDLGLIEVLAYHAIAAIIFGLQKILILEKLFSN